MKEIKLLYIALIFSLNLFSQKENCEIDFIIYSQYYLPFSGNEDVFQDYKQMLAKGRPAYEWTDFYENGNIIKRKFTTQTRGKHKGEIYSYENDLLKKVEYDGGNYSLRTFSYDEDDKLNSSKAYSYIFGDSETIFDYSADTIFIKELRGERNNEYSIVVDSLYMKTRYPYGNFIMYDENFTIHRNPDTYGYKYECYYDDCGNLKHYVEIIEDNKNIFKLIEYDIVYKE